MKRHWIWKGLRLTLFATAAAAALGYVVMALWNATLPAVAGFHSITFLQALGLLLLSRLLFGRLRGGHGGWRGRLHQRWHDMTPEQRAQFRGRMGCGPARHHRDPTPPAPQT